MGDRAYANNNTQTSLPVPPGRSNGAALNGTGSNVPKPVPARVPQYRPKPYAPPPRRYRQSRRNWCCSICLWLTLVIIGLVFLAAIATGILYVLYHPQKPAFNVTSLRLHTLNVSSSSDLVTTELDFTLTARNPNQKISFSYGDFSFSVVSNSVDLTDGSVPGFVLDPKNLSIHKVSLNTTDRSIDPSDGQVLAKKKSFELEIEIDTKAGVKIGRLRSFKIAIRVICSGISVSVDKEDKVVSIAPSPSGKLLKTPPAISGIDAKCKPKIKVLNWTF